MPDVRIKYSLDVYSVIAAQAAFQGLTNEEKQAVETFKKVNEEAVKAGKATETAAKKADEALKHTKDSAGRVRDEFGKFVPGAKKAEAAFGSLGNVAKSVGGAIAGYFSVQALYTFAKGVFDITAEFQKFEAVLTNTLGSNSRAQIALAQIQRFAADTPFSVQEATTAFLKLTNSGLKPTVDEMRAFSDLTSNAGKGLDQFAEAANDATRFEFERLKEFFIDASVKGDKVAFTFKNQTVQVDKNATAIKAYLVSLGNLPGVAGAGEAVMKTLGGQASNLGDSFVRLKVTIGGDGKGFFSLLIKSGTNVIDIFNDLIASTEQLGKVNSADLTASQLTLLESDFADFAAKAKASGKDVATELSAFTNQNIDFYKANLASAEEKLKEFEDKNSGFFDKLGRLNPGGRSRFDFTKQLSTLSGDVERYKALIANIPSIADQILKPPAPAKALGLIEAIEKEIAAITAARKAAGTEEEIRKLNNDLVAKQKQLNDLLKNEYGIIQKLDNALKDLAERRDRSTNKSQIEDLTKQIEFGQKYRARLLGDERKFEQDKLEIKKEASDHTFGLNAVAERRNKDDQQKARELGDAIRKEEERKEEDHQARMAAIKQAAFDVASELATGLFQLAAQNREAEIQDINIKREQELKRVGDDAQAKAFINAKFDRQEAAIKTRQAQADKAQALFGVLINTASAIVRQLAQTPLPIGAPFVAAIAAIGAIQGAVIAARPIPKFKDGTERVEGAGTSTSDSILARLSVGERVVPEAINRKLAGIPNIELPKIVSMGYEAMLKQHNVSGTMNNTEVVAAIEGLRKDLKKIPHNSINLDERGFKKYIFSGNSTTEVLNSQFNK